MAVDLGMIHTLLPNKSILRSILLDEGFSDHIAIPLSLLAICIQKYSSRSFLANVNFQLYASQKTDHPLEFLLDSEM